MPDDHAMPQPPNPDPTAAATGNTSAARFDQPARTTLAAAASP